MGKKCSISPKDTMSLITLVRITMIAYDIKNAENFASSEIFCNFAPDFIANQKFLKPRWRNR